MIELIKKYISRYIGKSSYKKNVLSMVTGRVFAQAIPILLTPILTRMYSPEEFGLFGVYFTIISLIAMVSTGRYCLAIILPKKDKKVEGLVVLSSLITVGVSLISLLFLLLTKGILFPTLNVQALDSYILLIFLNILVLGLYEAAFYYGLRNKQYKILSTNIVIQSLVNITARLLLGYLGKTEYGLLLSYLLGYSISYILLVLRLKIYSFNFAERFKVIKSLAKKYIQFPRFSLFADTLSMAANHSPNLFLSKIFGAIPTGYYSMSDKVLGSPIWFIMSSVGDVFKQEAAQQYREKGNCYDIFVKTAKSLFLFGIVPFILIFIFAPLLVPFVFGQNWEPVGIFIRIFSIMYFTRFVVGPVSYIVYIVEKQKLNIVFQGMKFVSIILAFIFGYLTKELNMTLLMWSLLTTLSYIVIFRLSLNLAKNSRYSKIKMASEG
jgi:O-antigen/teichoic acid export membrane protein